MFGFFKKGENGAVSDSVYLAVFLGNPGERYVNTRHNAGFIVGEALLSGDVITSASPAYRFREEYYGGKKVVFCFPHTMMNLSGNAVSHIVKKYGVVPENVIVVHDDVDILLGDLKLSFNRGEANHNGVISISRSLKTRKYGRVRLGVGPKDKYIPMNDFVMGEFSGEEIRKVKELAGRVGEILGVAVSSGWGEAMNKFN